MNRKRADVVLDPTTIQTLRAFSARSGVPVCRIIEAVMRDWLGLPSLTPGFRLEKPGKG